MREINAQVVNHKLIANANMNILLKLLLLSILISISLCQYYSSSSSYIIPIAVAFTIDDYRPSSIRPTYQQLSTKSTISTSIQQQQYTRLCISASSSTSLQMSSIGGGNMDNPNNNNNNDDDDNPINGWIGRKESDNVRRYREMNSEGRLPISYGAMNTNDDDSDDSNNVDKSTNEDKNDKFGPLSSNTQQTDAAIDATSSSSSLSKPTNPYLNVVSRLTPSDLISRFTSSASPRVQDAVRNTVLGLIGGLPQMGVETKTIATGERLASLMFQLQMTGYMFKNAEYRLSLTQSLERSDRMLPGDTNNNDEEAIKEGRGNIKGKIKVRYGGSNTNNSDEEDNDNKDESDTSIPGMEVEVDAASYLSELRGEVGRLRDELDVAKQAKEEEIRKDLLMYIRTLPPAELQQLTGTMSPEVLEAMKGLVTAVLAGISEDDEELEDVLFAGSGGGEQDGNTIGPNTVTEQSGEALAQLCMWQLVVGFNLRELEVRDSIKKNMLPGGGGSEGEDNDGAEWQ